MDVVYRVMGIIHDIKISLSSFSDRPYLPPLSVVITYRYLVVFAFRASRWLSKVSQGSRVMLSNLT
jgi:hypothetical protein